MTIARAKLAAWVGIILLAACAGPTDDPSELKAIRAEAEILMARPIHRYATVPKDRWPRAIAGLEPEGVTVYPHGVEILMKPDFDGGWGYFVPKDEREPPEPAARYSDLGHGVYWYRPY